MHAMAMQVFSHGGIERVSLSMHIYVTACMSPCRGSGHHTEDLRSGSYSMYGSSSMCCP